MRIEYTGRHMDVPDSVRRLGDRKLRKLAKHLRGITDVHVILTADKHRHTAEVTVHSPHGDLAATGESSDIGVSLSTVMDKLIRQAERRVGKLRVRKGGGRSRATSLRTAAAPVSAPRGESSGGISPRSTRTHNSDSVGWRGITISGFSATRRRSRTYPNRPLGFTRSGP